MGTGVTPGRISTNSFSLKVVLLANLSLRLRLGFANLKEPLRTKVRTSLSLALTKCFQRLDDSTVKRASTLRTPKLMLRLRLAFTNSSACLALTSSFAFARSH